MSQENVEIVRNWTDGWLQSGNLADLGDLSFLDPEIVYEDNILPDHIGETYHGHEGFRKAWARAIEPWGSIEGDLEWVRGAGDEVVSCHRGRMLGKGSGIEVEIRYAYLWRFEAGRVVFCKSFGDPAEALEAAGLGE
jgi:ketosteroid isomerase-like protein